MEMGGRKINGQICTQQFDVPELIQRIQSLLPLKEAARTCVLSKSWLHAWSTIPNLRFRQYEKHLNNKQMKEYIRLIVFTLGRYLRENMPVTSFDLEFSIRNKKSDSRIYKYVQKVASKSCLKDLNLQLIIFETVNFNFTLPDEIFSSENLNRLSVSSVNVNDKITSSTLVIGSNVVIKCVNLRVLELHDVYINEEVLDNLLSTCTLLENIDISLAKDSKMTLTVKSLPYLRKLNIKDTVLEIYHLPSLYYLSYCNLSSVFERKSIVFNTNSLGNVRELFLKYVTIDDCLVDIIKYKFPFLESLTLDRVYCSLGHVDIKCVFLKSLIINLLGGTRIDMQVHAPKLQSFYYEGRKVPCLMFPFVAPEHITLTFGLNHCIDESFFLKMREVLNIPTKLNIKIKYLTCGYWKVPFNINDVRSMVPVPATNVEKLTFRIDSDNGVWVNPLFFDALFSIIHPNYVKVKQFQRCKKKIAKLMMLELKTQKEDWPDLKDVEIRNHINGKWETLTSSWISSPTGMSCLDNCYVNFKLDWCPL